MASLIDAPRGADLLLSYIFPDGTDLGGYTAAFTVYDQRNGARLLSAAPAVNGNLLSLAVRAADIDALPVNSDDSTLAAPVWFDLIVTTPAGNACKLHGGLMRILPYGAQIAPEGGFVEVSLDGQVVAVEVAPSGFDTAVLALAEGYAATAQAGAATAAQDAGVATIQAQAAATSAATAQWSATQAGTAATAAAQSAGGAATAQVQAAQSQAGAAVSAVNAGTAATTASQAAASLSSLLSTSIVLRPLAAESGYVFAVIDAAGRAAATIGTDGSLTVSKWTAGTIPATALAAQAVTTAALADGNVTFAKLDNASVGKYLPKVLGPESGYVWAVTDAANRLAIGVAPDGTFTAAKLALPAASVDFAQLTPGLSGYVARPLSPESGYVWGVVDASNRMALGIQPDGTVMAAKMPLPAASVDFAQLSGNLSGYVAKPLSAESGYVWGVVDAAGRIGLGVQTDGTVVGKLTGLLAPGSVTAADIAAGAVGEAKLDPVIDRLAVPHAGDVVEVMPDKWRARYGTIAARSAIDGTGWTRFPHTLTRVLRGKNLSGTTLQFRKSAGLMFRGLRDAGTWDPNANTTINSTNYVGQLLAGFTAPATAGRSAGDYYRCIGTTATAFDGQSLMCGDLVVYNGTSWKAQLAPRYNGVLATPQNGRLEGDFWKVATAGTFDGTAYAAGDRIVHIGFDSLSGSGQPLWYKGQAGQGELFYKGEFVPGTSNLSGAAMGDVYQASAAGSDATSGLSFGVADYAVFDHYATWGNVASAPITAVAANAMIPGLACATSAGEWEFRRADKSATVIGVAPTVLHQTAPRRSADGIVLLSDSMFGVANTQGQLSALVTPRSVSLISRGGGTSRNVMSTYEWYVATQADPYRGAFTFIWQGQNNQPSAVGDANWCQIVETALELRNLLGARDRRFCFLSILGIDAMTFDGTRIHVTQHEAMFAGAAQNHVLWQLEQWYAAMFPGQWISPRLALLSAAVNSPILDARYPGSGMTEAQTAAAFGWVPLSFWNAPTGGWPYPLGSLSLKGYWNAASLPTGGAAADCYTLSAAQTYNGVTYSVGALLINVAGTWTPYYADQTHQGSGAGQGGQYLAAAMAGFLSSNVL